MKLRKTLALLALVAGGLLVQPVASAEGWFSDLDDAKEATLSELVSRPHDFLDVAVKIEVYFDRTVSNYNPYYTRFSDKSWPRRWPRPIASPDGAGKAIGRQPRGWSRRIFCASSTKAKRVRAMLGSTNFRPPKNKAPQKDTNTN